MDKRGAGRIAEALPTGPLPTAAVREVVGDRGRYDQAMSAPQRHLLVTAARAHAHRSGWPAIVVDRTYRLFDVNGGPQTTATQPLGSQTP